MSLPIDAWGIAEQVGRGQVTARHVLESCLATIARHDEQINAFVYLDVVRARETADGVDRRLGAGEPVGPLAGVPFGVKELQSVKGWPDTAASIVFAERRAKTTSTLVDRLIGAGAVPVGLTASPEFGRSSFCSTRLHGTTCNPWDHSRTPGGSSGGSAAAVSAGMVPMATGSDGAGSLRIPASFCGVVGYKPTFGLVSRGPGYGGCADNQSFGPITTSVRDVALFMDSVAGVDDADLTSIPAPGRFVPGLARPPETPRIAFSRDLGYSPIDRRVADLAADAFRVLAEALAARVVDIGNISFPDCAHAFRVLSMLDVRAQVRELGPLQMGRLERTASQYSQFTEQCTFDDYIDAQESRHALATVVADVLARTDLVVTPATSITAFSAAGPMPTEIAGQRVDHWGSLRLTFPFNLTGNPVISVPAGFIDGLPVGLQIIGRRFADDLVLRTAAVFEQAAPWPIHARVPVGTADV